ncbi:MAG: hypothetical protein M1495_09070 [Bacteroidetes bacterium]|nr:hypothetical protein [Bacteroidota bacterium]
MRLKFYVIFFLLLLLTNCREGIVEFQQPSQTQTAVQTANIYISSFPSGADIYWENNSTNKVTPDSLIAFSPEATLLNSDFLAMPIKAFRLW